MKINFLGAAGTVTGSKYLIETQDKNILVDCGLFQGLKELRLLNWERVSFDVKKILRIIAFPACVCPCASGRRESRFYFKKHLFELWRQKNIITILVKSLLVK